ncbi:DUF4262 domain-containing protein [Catenuloplanes indicus]|uniref:DUF4262 domain-containing protein n=1 Tax=Catenuloplanes indicus TaxID=137267 RepID=A0AAE4B120_9ACTN|nr:DUF4262 domain-containing protein [Catenuloplanes indicus]MDQ0370174.1 hypothetical protein [Catenuloplanes indicus]
MDDQSCHCLLCTAPAGSPEGSPDAPERTTADRIRRFGWTVTGDPASNLAYSTGLWHTFRAPEICVLGVPARLGRRIVTAVGNLIGDGDTLLDGERRDDVLTGYDVVVRAVRDGWHPRFFGAGLDFYRRTRMPMMQIVWPDRAGRFPWEPGTDAGYRAAQPSLWLHPEDDPAGS